VLGCLQNVQMLGWSISLGVSQYNVCTERWDLCWKVARVINWVLVGNLIFCYFMITLIQVKFPRYILSVISCTVETVTVYHISGAEQVS
jgi:hypothetical protein